MSQLSEALILESLAQIIDPDLRKDIVTLGFVRDMQGLNDPRVPASESQQMVAKIRARGGEVWYLAAKDEGHGFRKKSNRDFYQRTIVTFLEKQLGRK
jgi:hypothetical protein